MIRINRKIEYSLMALKHMSEKRPGELSSVKEISESYGCPFDATSKVLQVMGQNKILKAEHGPSGGYMIIKDLTQLSLHSLMELVLGPVGLAKCIQQAETCDLAKTCNIIGPVTVLNQRLVDFYKSLTVQDLIQPKTERHAVMEKGL